MLRGPVAPGVQFQFILSQRNDLAASRSNSYSPYKHGMRISYYAGFPVKYLVRPFPKALLPDDSGRYKLLLNHNGYVAGQGRGHTAYEFVTWQWDSGHEQVSAGHYMGDHYQTAKQDFAVRCGLVDHHRLCD